MRAQIFLSAGWDIVPDGKWVYTKGAARCLRIHRRPEAGIDLLKVLKSIPSQSGRGLSPAIEQDLIRIGILTTNERKQAIREQVRIAELSRVPPSVGDYLPTSGGLFELARMVESDRIERPVLAGCRVGSRFFFVLATRPSTIERLCCSVRAACETCFTYGDLVISRTIASKGAWPGPVGYWLREEKALLEMELLSALDSPDELYIWEPKGKARRLQDEPQGVIAYVVGEVITEQSSKEVFCSKAIQRSADLSVDESEWQPWCTSADRSSSDSRLKCMMECAERYMATDYWPDEAETVTGSWQELRDIALDPLLLTLPLEANCNRTHLHRTLWCYGKTWARKESVLAPLQLVTLRAVPKALRLPIPRSTTTGVAAHCQPEAAIHNAMLEVFERNALLSAWVSFRSPQRIDLGSLPNTTRQLADLVSDEGHELILLEVTNWGLPVILAFAFPINCGGALYAKGSAASERPEDAVSAALYEIHRSLHFRRGLSFSVPTARQINTPWDHVAYHSQVHRERRLRAWALSGPIKPFDSIPERSLTSIVTEHSFEPVLFWLGMSGSSLTVRVMIPGVISLTYGAFSKAMIEAARLQIGIPADQQRESPSERLVHPFG